MDDIAPGLLEKIRKDFLESLGDAAPAEQTYKAAGDYAEQVGQALSQAFQRNLGSDSLPDRKMYWNIAERVVQPMLEDDYSLASDAAVAVQQALNEKAGIGIKAQRAPIDKDRVDGILNRLCAADQYDDVAWLLGEPVVNLSRSVVDNTLKANAEFQAKAGRNPRIIRKAEAKCCEWCSNLEGVYEYPDNVPDDIYRRHENCRCIVEYDPGDGRRQNVHTKQWTDPGERDKIEERKRVGLKNLDTFRPIEYQGKIAQLVKVDRTEVLNLAKSGAPHGNGGVYNDAVRKTKKELQKSIVSRTAQVERHADKISHPERYVPDWNEKSKNYQDGLLRKWEKDMQRNAKQATIELEVLKERFGQ